MRHTEEIEPKPSPFQAADAVPGANRRSKHLGGGRSHPRPEPASSAGLAERKYRCWRAFVVVIILGLL